MAGLDDRTLLGAIRSASLKLANSTTWPRSGLPARTSDPTNFIYEIYVYFSLIEDLGLRYRLRYVPGADRNRHLFPRNSANKRGRPRFEVLDPETGATRFQVCAGTRAMDTTEKERAPDVSFQTAAAPEEPTAEHVLMIWDAKYRTDPTDRISDDDFARFQLWVQLLHCKEVIERPVLTKLAGMEGNCLVSNGNFSSENLKSCEVASVREARSFYPGEPFDVRPPDS